MGGTLSKESSPETVNGGSSSHHHNNNNNHNNNQPPLLGLDLSYLDELLQACGGRTALEGLSTTEVCDQFIQPWTCRRSSGGTNTLSLCDVLAQQGHAAVGTPTLYVSHAWNGPFLEVVDALVEYYSQSSSGTGGAAAKGVVVWWQLLCSNQHAFEKSLEYEWLETQSRVAEIGHSLLVVTNPSYFTSPNETASNPFTRAWCFLELYATAMAAECRFDIAMTRHHRLEFQDCLTQDRRNILHQLETTILRAEQSEWSPHNNNNNHNNNNKQRMEHVMRKTIGYTKLNKTVLDLIRNWAIQTTMESQLQSLATLGLLYQSQAKYAQAEAFLLECTRKAALLVHNNHTIFRGGDPQHHPLWLKYNNYLASVFMDQGQYDKAQALVEACLNGTLAVLGDKHVDTLLAMDNAARWYCSNGDYEQARELLHQSLSKREATLGLDHPETLASVDRLASVYLQFQKEYAQAESLLEDCHEGRKQVLGENHPDTLATLNNLALLYQQKGDIDKAQMLLQNCLLQQQEVLGQDHPATLTTMNNVAALEMKHHQQGEYLDEAKALLLESKGSEHLEDHDNNNNINSHNTAALATIDNLEVVSRRLEKHQPGKQLATMMIEPKGSNSATLSLTTSDEFSNGSSGSPSPHASPKQIGAAASAAAAADTDRILEKIESDSEESAESNNQNDKAALLVRKDPSHQSPELSDDDEDDDDNEDDDDDVDDEDYDDTDNDDESAGSVYLQNDSDRHHVPLDYSTVRESITSVIIRRSRAKEKSVKKTHTAPKPNQPEDGKIQEAFDVESRSAWA